jgi:hypothetical protein
VGPVVFVRESGAPHSDSITFSATQGKSYVVDLDDEASQGSDATVTLNGVTLLSHRVTGRAAAQHYHELVVLRDINTLVVRLVGRPGSTLRVAIWLFRPVTLDAVTLAPGTPLEIAGPAARFTATITNHTNAAVSGARLQTSVQQPGASRAAGEAVIRCGPALGLLPTGTCEFADASIAARNGAVAAGALVAGPALAIVRVRDSASEVLDSLVVPITLTGPSVATVAILPPSVTLKVGDRAQLTATLYDLEGNVIDGRAVTWSSSKPTVATVDTRGLVVGVAAGGPITITAASGGKNGSSQVTVLPWGIITGIGNIRAFLDRCPTNDPLYAQIRQSFEIRVDGQLVIGSLPCTEPYSTMPIDQLTDELIAVQVVRTAYYMSQGTEGRLPWTPKAFAAWMSSRVSGVNLKTAPGQLYCCDLIDGKLYLSNSRYNASQREFYRTWLGISGQLGYYAHEIRHADPGAPGHTTGCPTFPLPTDPAGCDATYDLTNLGSYGIQYWLEASWATGYLNVGIGCSPSNVAWEYAYWHQNSANMFRDRIVSGTPPVVSATLPYGGPCVTP